MLIEHHHKTRYLASPIDDKEIQSVATEPTQVPFLNSHVRVVMISARFDCKVNHNHVLRVVCALKARKRDILVYDLTGGCGVNNNAINAISPGNDQVGEGDLAMKDGPVLHCIQEEAVPRHRQTHIVHRIVSVIEDAIAHYDTIVLSAPAEMHPRLKRVLENYCDITILVCD